MHELLFWDFLYFNKKTVAQFFKTAKQFADVLAQKDAAREHLSNHIAQFKDEVMFRYGDANQWTLQSMIGFWVKSLFQVRYLYWPQHELLGIIGTEWPKPCLSLAPHMDIFQNSTDQDYELSTWNKSIPLFANILK